MEGTAKTDGEGGGVRTKSTRLSITAAPIMISEAIYQRTHAALVGHSFIAAHIRSMLRACARVGVHRSKVWCVLNDRCV